MSQTDVTRIFSNTGENGCPIASFAYRFNSSFVVKSIYSSISFARAQKRPILTQFDVFTGGCVRRDSGYRARACGDTSGCDRRPSTQPRGKRFLPLPQAFAE